MTTLFAPAYYEACNRYPLARGGYLGRSERLWQFLIFRR